MKQTLYILVIFFALPFTGYTQNDSVAVNKDTPNFNKQLDINIELLGVAFGYKRRIHNHWFLGTKISAGFIGSYIHYNSGNSTSEIEVFNTSLLLQYSFNNLFLIESGPKFSLLFDDEGQSNPRRLLWEIGLYVGIKKIQLGIRFGFFAIEDSGIGFINQNEKYSNSFLIIRIPLKKW